MCANIDCANTSGGFVCAICTHIQISVCASACNLFSFSFFFASLRVLVGVSFYPDYQSSAPCLTTGAVSFDCIDLVPAASCNER